MIVAIEGGDQAGKKTQTAMLARALRKQKVSTATFSFPDYRTPVGGEISKYLDGRRKFPPQVIHCLLAANRWEKLGKIQEAVSKNSVVIMNRYYHSNLVYGAANGLGTDWLENLDRGLPKADLVILLDIPGSESFQRKKAGRDRFEKDGDFIQKILKTYRAFAKERRWKVVDASRPRDEVHQDILGLFSKKVGL